MDLVNVAISLDAALGAQIEEIRKVADEGLRLQPHPPISIKELEDLVLPTLEKFNWIVTSLKNGVLAEPRYTSERIVSEGTKLYHVSDRINRANIQTEGLKLGRGGNTRLQRKYPDRIFLALGLEAANTFIDFQCRNTNVVFSGGRLVLGNPVRERDEFDIWQISAGKDDKFFTDILFPGEAVWTETSFPPNSINLVV